MKTIFISLMICLTGIRYGWAANVIWNSLTVEQDALGGYYVRYPYLTMQALVVGDTVTLWADRYDYMELASTWIRAERGECVTAERIQQSPLHFYQADFWTGEGDNVHTDYSIQIQRGSSVYLAIFSRIYQNPMDYDVAWIELGYDAGRVYALSSAIDYDGGSLVVGAIPEPSCGLTALIGFAGLLLWHRRVRCA